MSKFEGEKASEKKYICVRGTLIENLIYRDKTNTLFMSTIELSQKVDKSKNKIASNFN